MLSRRTAAARTCVLVARDRTGQTVSRTIERSDAVVTLTRILKPRIERDSLLCTEDAPVYAAFAEHADLSIRLQ